MLVIILMGVLTIKAQEISDYNVIWNTPSQDAAGSMPIGNGEVGANIWVERNGDLVFYLSRTDSYSETGEQFKLGKVRVSFQPNILSGKNFMQKLQLQDGCILISAGEGKKIKLRFWIDCDQPVVFLQMKSDIAVQAKVVPEIWRNSAREILDDESRSVQGHHQHYMTYPDEVISDRQRLSVCHVNQYSVFPDVIRLEKLNYPHIEDADPYIGKCFGYSVYSPSFVKAQGPTLKTAQALKDFTLQITALCGKYGNSNNWLKASQEISEKNFDAKRSFRKTSQWWKDFWNKSYIYVSTPDRKTGFKITQSYILQSWMTACGGRGNYPIKFNGSIFTVDPQLVEDGKTFSPDYRDWGGDYWWQNTRLAYHPMLKAGYHDMMKPLFNMYSRALPMLKANARCLLGAQGAFTPETMTPFGTYAPTDFGWDRTGLRDGFVQNVCMREYWTSGLELVGLMLDYYNYSDDDVFAKQQLMPMAREILKFYDTYYQTYEIENIYDITPTHVLETYKYDVANDMVSVAGLRYDLLGLLSLPNDLNTPQDTALWNTMWRKLPKLPTRIKNNTRVYSPAQSFRDLPMNRENPELYNVFPFNLCNISTSDYEMGKNTFINRTSKKYSNGWTQDGQFAARLGQTQDAVNNLLIRCDNKHPKFRFPAMWGPNYDWLPDQCHGGNLMLTLQEMVMQCYGDVVYLLPAFPKEWDVKFRLYAPHHKIVEAVIKQGKLVKHNNFGAYQLGK